MQLANVTILEKIHAQFLSDPQSVDASWRYFFEGVEFGGLGQSDKADIRSFYLIEAYRHFGHLKANLNPIALCSPPKPAELALSRFGLSQTDLRIEFPTFGILSVATAPLEQIIQKLEQIYCGTIAYEYMSAPYEVQCYIQERIEGERVLPTIEQKRQIFHHLNRAELFEIFLHKRYVGQKRFSLEGAETLISILNELIDAGSEFGVEEMIMGMAHRGRLNVLTNVLGKSYEMVFSEFEDFYEQEWVGGDGDVKYHKGFSAFVNGRKDKKVRVSVTANPSHLESVCPVVQGRVFAKQIQRGDEQKKKVLPILIHGDASLSGQGIVYETMQMSKIPGYGSGGTIHICVENQVGFTTLAREYRSMRYSTDIAHAFGFPVLHVNGEDPEACLFAADLALEIRQKFHLDIFINMYCYRKYGHNESDEPSFTQPKQYQLIKSKKSIRELYRDHLIQQGSLEQAMATTLENEFQNQLSVELNVMSSKKQKPLESAFEDRWKHYRQADKSVLFDRVTTGVPQNELKKLAKQLSHIPEDVTLHPKLKKLIEERSVRVEGNIDWALAEHLAFASLLWEGCSVRLSGQDSQRGTFTQRHAVWVDQETGKSYYPLSHLKEGQGRFDVYNSPLSEFGVLGFEFGYSLAAPDTLVLWEAQFGDFSNEAQVMVDQYLAVSEQKWRRFSGVVMLLPHGYEGQGAEHSSARLERYLQLCGNGNMQVVYPTTPAQYFHLLRRQIMRPIRIPLIVMTPKGLLRHPSCVNKLEDLEKETFEEIIDLGSGDEKRLILCSGRIYYDLIAEKRSGVSIVRIEQLYPLAKKQLATLFQKYSSAKNILWVQEEPQNMGAWNHLYPIFAKMGKGDIQYVGRKKAAATATGSHKVHVVEQKQLIEKAFDDQN